VAGIARIARLLLVVSTFAVVFAPGQVAADQAPSAQAVTAAVLAPTPDAASTPAAASPKDVREQRLVAAVLLAVATVLLGGFHRRQPAAPPRTGTVVRFDPARPRRGPPALVA
jgi:hypothetical protein